MPYDTHTHTCGVHGVGTSITTVSIVRCYATGAIVYLYPYIPVCGLLYPSVWPVISQCVACSRFPMVCLCPPPQQRSPSSRLSPGLSMPLQLPPTQGQPIPQYSPHRPIPHHHGNPTRLSYHHLPSPYRLVYLHCIQRYVISIYIYRI